MPRGLGLRPSPPKAAGMSWMPPRPQPWVSLPRYTPIPDAKQTCAPRKKRPKHHPQASRPTGTVLPQVRTGNGRAHTAGGRARPGATSDLGVAGGWAHP